MFTGHMQVRAGGMPVVCSARTGRRMGRRELAPKDVSRAGRTSWARTLRRTWTSKRTLRQRTSCASISRSSAGCPDSLTSCFTAARSTRSSFGRGNFSRAARAARHSHPLSRLSGRLAARRSERLTFSLAPSFVRLLLCRTRPVLESARVGSAQMVAQLSAWFSRRASLAWSSLVGQHRRGAARHRALAGRWLSRRLR